MALLNWLKTLFPFMDSDSSWPDEDVSSDASASRLFGDDDHCAVNPANGLPMVGGCGGLDVEGNPFGVDFHDGFSTGSGSLFDDSFGSCSRSLFDDD